MKRIVASFQIILSALAFDSGADDYLEKLFPVGELIAGERTTLRYAWQNDF